MKIFQKMKLMAIGLIAQNEVIAFFRDASAGAGLAYKDGDFVGENGSMTDNSKGKQIIVNAGNGKFKILAFDTDGTNGNKNAHWFAPIEAWVKNPNVATSDIDFANSDIIYGNGETVTLAATIDQTKNIPFKRVGNAIKYDASLAPNAPVSSFSGSGGGTNTPAPTPLTNTNTNTPPPAPAPLTKMKSLAWYIWAIIVVVVIVIIVALKSVFGGKKDKVVKK